MISIIISKNEAHAIADCLDSVAWADEIIVLDSGSTDDTLHICQQLGAKVTTTDDWPGFGAQKNRALALATQPWVLSIDADERVTTALEAQIKQANLGCGVAWNQGALALQAEWTIIMNNDVIVGEHWIENLIETAEKNNLKVISPSLIEGELDYDFEEFSTKAHLKMAKTVRFGARHAVCLAVHQSVWLEVGYFQPIPKLLGYEDTMFFNELAKANIATGITGASWLHHFGSITQSAMKQERGLTQKDNLGYRYNYRLLKQSWLTRKLIKLKKVRQEKKWSAAELKQFGLTMHGLRMHGEFVWK